MRKRTNIALFTYGRCLWPRYPLQSFYAAHASIKRISTSIPNATSVLDNWYLCIKLTGMLALLQEENWFIQLSRFMGGVGIFLVIGIILIVVVVYKKFFKNR